MNTRTIEKSIPKGMLFFYYTSKVQGTGLEGDWLSSVTTSGKIGIYIHPIDMYNKTMI